MNARKPLVPAVPTVSILIAFICLLLTACSHRVWQSVPPTPSVPTNFGRIELSPLFIDNDPQAGYEGFRLRVTNDTDKDISIVWQKTFYVMKGQSNGWFFFSGDYYAQANDPKPPDVIFKKSEYTKKIYPVKLLEHDSKKDEWWDDPMPAGENGIYLTFEVEGLNTNRKVTADLGTIERARPIRYQAQARKN